MDNLALIAAIVLGFLNVYMYFHYRREEKQERIREEKRMESIRQETKSKENTEATEVKPETRDLAFSLLRKIGCIPEGTDEGRIQFEYQGIMFLMEAVDDCLFVNLIWPWCHSFSKFDIDEFSRVRQVVNEINMQGTVSVFYGVTTSDDVAIHIKKHFLLVPEIRDLEGYLRLMLDSFFRTARTLDLEIEKCRIAEQDK